MKLIIPRSSNHEHFFSIFQLTDNNHLKRFHMKKTFDLALFSEKKYNLAFLPNELKMKIIKILIHQYLKEALYELAMPLLALCKYTLFWGYHAFFPPPIFPISCISHNYRLSHTLLLCQSIVDTVVGQEKGCSEYYLLEIHHGHYSGLCQPWYLDTDIVVSEVNHLFVKNVQEHKVFDIGKDIHHYAWIQSREKDGIHYCSYFKSPIIVLALVNFYNMLITSKNQLDSNFIAVKLLLQKVFGKHMGLYLHIYDTSDLEMHSVEEL